ncbi:ABC transporter substrate-binding protein [Paenibacillus flagellatus]|nr:ABC transporter substrate-binding protein [Paenibacillus flagellatus]
MKTLKKGRLASLLLAVGLSTALLSACGGAGGAADGTKESGPGTTPPAGKDPVEIVFITPQTGRTEEQFMKETGNDIQAKFPHVKVKFIPYAKGTQTADLIAAGQPIDIIGTSTSTISELTQFGLQFDMSSLIKTHGFDINRLEPSLVDFIRDFSNGGIYGLPTGTGIFTLLYNKSLFDKFGVSYPKEGMTWDEVYELAKTMTRQEGGVQYFGLVTSISHMLNNNQLSAAAYDPKTNRVLIEDDKFKSVVNNFARFFQLADKEHAKDLLSKHSALFKKEQRAAMYAYYGTDLVAYPGEFEWGSVSMPFFKEAMGAAPQFAPSYMSVAATSTHKDQAFEIIAYLLSDEYQMKMSRQGTVTSLKSPDIRAAFAQDQPSFQGKSTKPYSPDKAAAITPKDQLSGIAISKAYTAFSKIVNGESDVNSALREAAEAAAKEIEAKKQGK